MGRLVTLGPEPKIPGNIGLRSQYIISRVLVLLDSTCIRLARSKLSKDNSKDNDNSKDKYGGPSLRSG
jgi:hypothetical protein